MAANLEKVIGDQLLAAAEAAETQIDAEIERLEKMDQAELDELKEKRIQAMKRSQAQREEYLALGHGEYQEVYDEKEFFEFCKKSKNLICHFGRDSTFRCKIVDKHLALLARKHVEARFCKINAERSKFLVDKLKIRVLPTIAICRDSKMVDYIVGFDDLGGHDEFSTEMIEWRLAQAKVLNYSGDLTKPPEDAGASGDARSSLAKSILGRSDKKTVRGGQDDESSDDDM